MPIYLAKSTAENEAAAFGLADAVEALRPEPLEVECYDVEGHPELCQVVATFALPPDAVMLAVLAEAFGATGFEVVELPVNTHSALTTLAGEAAARALAEALEALDPAPYGVGAFEIEDGSGLWEVGVYFHSAPDAATLDALGRRSGAKPFVISEVPDQDWVAHVRRELKPVEAGRFFVYGSHDADRVPKDPSRVPLQIEATVAFGTGHHNTTLGCLLAFDRLFAAGWRPERVADIGSGTGVLAMAAAKVLPGARIIASDIDQVAVDVARANLRVNDLDGRIACLEAAGFAHPDLHRGSPYDLIFANILKGPLVELAPEMGRHCAPGGRLILSGLLVVQADSVILAYLGQGFALERRDDLGEWAVLVLLRN